MNKIRLWLNHPWVPIAVALLAMALTIPSLWNGFNFEDSFHRLILLEDPLLGESPASPLNMFCFANGDVESNRQIKNSGAFAWWAPESFKVCFFRPLSTLTHWVDYLLWPNAPILMHFQNLVWFGILV